MQTFYDVVTRDRVISRNFDEGSTVPHEWRRLQRKLLYH